MNDTKHKDAMNRQVEEGDLVALGGAYDGSLYYMIIRNFTPKGISGLRFWGYYDESLGAAIKVRAASLDNKSNLHIASAFTMREWGNGWDLASRMIKLDPKEVLSDEEYKAYIKLKTYLGIRDESEPTNLRL